MKILFLTNIPSPYRVAFFNELGKKVDLTVLFERKAASDRDKKFQDYGFNNFKGIFINGIKFGADGTIAFRKKWKKEVRKDYDYIICGCYHTITSVLQMNYMIKRNIPYFMSIDGLFIRQDSKFKYKMKKKIFSNAKGFFTTGSYSQRTIEYYGGKNINIYPFSSISEKNLYKFDIENQNNLKKEFGLERRKVFLSVGQFIHRKGYDLLLKAFKVIDTNSSLIIIGGEETDEYRNIIDEQKIKNVHFIKFVPFSEIMKYYQLADVFVLPTREDTWGLVINEALANSLPVITTNTCLAGVEMIDESIGSLYDAENIEKLQELLKYYENITEEENLNYRKNAYNKAKKYTIESMAKAHIDILSKD